MTYTVHMHTCCIIVRCLLLVTLLKNFGHLITICVLFVVGIICYTLYKVWAKKRKQESNRNGSSRRLVPTDVSVVDTESDWEAAYIKLSQDLHQFKVIFVCSFSKICSKTCHISVCFVNVYIF